MIFQKTPELVNGKTLTEWKRLLDAARQATTNANSYMEPKKRFATKEIPHYIFDREKEAWQAIADIPRNCLSTQEREAYFDENTHKSPIRKKEQKKNTVNVTYEQRYNGYPHVYDDDNMDMQGNPAHVLVLPVVWCEYEQFPQVLTGLLDGRCSVGRGSLTFQDRQAQYSDNKGGLTEPAILHAQHYWQTALRVGSHQLISKSHQQWIEHDFSPTYTNPVWRLDMLRLNDEPCMVFAYYLHKSYADDLVYMWDDSSSFLPLEQLIEKCRKEARSFDPLLRHFLAPYTQDNAGVLTLDKLLCDTRGAYEYRKKAHDEAVDADLRTRY